MAAEEDEGDTTEKAPLKSRWQHGYGSRDVVATGASNGRPQRVHLDNDDEDDREDGSLSPSSQSQRLMSQRARFSIAAFLFLFSLTGIWLLNVQPLYYYHASNNLDELSTADNNSNSNSNADISIGRFLFITDIHLEPYYSPHSQLAEYVCRPKSSSSASSSCDPAAWMDVDAGATTMAPSTAPTTTDPFSLYYPLGRINCDPPSLLFESALVQIADMMKTDPIDFVLVGGDLAAHVLPCVEVKDAAIGRVVELISRYLPNIPVIPTMGNADLYPDYHVSSSQPLPEPNPSETFSPPPAGSCDPELVGMAGHFIAAGWLSSEKEKGTFCNGGFFSRTMNLSMANQPVSIVSDDDDNHNYDNNPSLLKIISLNTLLWSTSAVYREKEKGTGSFLDRLMETGTPCSDRGNDPRGQFAWLGKQLAHAEKHGRRVLLLGHVPPGDKRTITLRGQANLCPVYTTKLSALTRRYHKTIVGQLYGDQSDDEFRMVWGEDGPSILNSNSNSNSNSQISVSSAPASSSSSSSDEEAESSSPTPHTSSPTSSSSSSPTSSPSSTLPPSTSSSSSRAPAEPPSSSSHQTRKVPVSGVFINPGLTPRKHCNPAFRVYTFARNNQLNQNENPSPTLLDYHQYYLPLERTNAELRAARNNGNNNIINHHHHHSQNSGDGLNQKVGGGGGGNNNNNDNHNDDNSNDSEDGKWLWATSSPISSSSSSSSSSPSSSSSSSSSSSAASSSLPLPSLVTARRRHGHHRRHHHHHRHRAVVEETHSDSNSNSNSNSDSNSNSNSNSYPSKMINSEKEAAIIHRSNLLRQFTPWRFHYSFREAYGATDLTPHQLLGVMRELASNFTMMEAYQARFAVLYPSTWESVSFLCDMAHLDQSDNDRCKDTGMLQHPANLVTETE